MEGISDGLISQDFEAFRREIGIKEAEVYAQRGERNGCQHIAGEEVRNSLSRSTGGERHEKSEGLSSLLGYQQSLRAQRSAQHLCFVRTRSERFVAVLEGAVPISWERAQDQVKSDIRHVSPEEQPHRCPTGIFD